MTSFSRKVEATSFPPIVNLKKRAAHLKDDPDFIDLSQAVPSYPPPPGVIDEIVSSASDPATHLYTPDQGLGELRDEISGILGGRFGVSASPDDILVTAGANHAYMTVLTAILEEGDEVVLFTPYYFNHHMAITLLGGVPVEVPLDPENGFDPDIEVLARALTPKTRAITIVNPNNPTGSSISPDVLERIAALARPRDIFLISDETYQFFQPDGAGSHSMAAIGQGQNRTFTIGSFSKTFSLTGWRAGFVAAPPGWMDGLLKIQDTMIICAPHSSQRAALAGLRGCLGWVADRAREISEKVSIARNFDFNGSPFRVATAGAFFCYLENSTGITAGALSDKILDQEKVLVIPGDYFGSGQERFHRLALGGVDCPKLSEALNRLKNMH